jgi:hypothetical protein
MSRTFVIAAIVLATVTSLSATSKPLVRPAKRYGWTGPRAPVQRAGGPDDYGYEFKDNDEPGGPVYNWIDTTGATAETIFGDDNRGPVELPFGLSFYGQTYDSIWVCTNGWFSFGPDPDTSGYASETIPAPGRPNQAVYPLWDDLQVGPDFGGSVYSVTVGTEPSRRFVVIWQDVLLRFMPDPVSFEVVLDESDSSVTFEYQDVCCGDWSSDSGGTACVGIESDLMLRPRQTGLEYSFWEKSLCDGRAVRFSLVPRASHDVGVVEVVAPVGPLRTGSHETPSVLVRNLGREPESGFGVVCSIVGRDGALRFRDERLVATLQPGGVRQVSFAGWVPGMGETVAVRVRTVLVGDERPENDGLESWVAVHQGYFYGGPDAGFMRWLDSDTSCGPVYEWRDIRSSGTPVVFPDYDNSFAKIPIGFGFEFYDTSYETCYVGTNGYLTFGRGTTKLVNESIPDAALPNNAVYALWDDLDCLDSGRVRFERLGSSPSCTLVVSFDSVAYAQGGDSSLSFQVLLVEGSNDVVVQYRDVVTGNQSRDRGLSATCGVEGPSGLWGLCYLYGEGSRASPPGNLVSSGRAIRYFFGGRAGDVGITGIVAPRGQVSTNGVVEPSARWRNFYSLPTDLVAYCFLESPLGVRVYGESVKVSRLAPGEESTVVFPRCSVGVAVGRWGVRCSSAAFADTNGLNDVLSDSFVVAAPPGIWNEVRSVPEWPSGRRVKDGAWLVFDASLGLVYASKGNKAAELYSYDPARDTWTGLTPEPAGVEGRPPGKGASACASGDGVVYASKGNNTVGFYRYEAGRDSWAVLSNVPLGTGGRKVRGGGDMAFGARAGADCVYLLKGMNAEFYRYDATRDTWQALPDAPAGTRGPKWNKGSWLVHDGNHTLYAHKAKYHELWMFDADADTWSKAPKRGMPFVNSQGRSKKSKDGGCATWMAGDVYALKGGNTQEFWRYEPDRDSWTELDTIPSVGSSVTRRKVKTGADLTSLGTSLAAFKGGKTDEYWTYTPRMGTAPAAGCVERPGVQAGSFDMRRSQVVIAPSPVTSGFATLHFGRGLEGPVAVRICDVAGRTVLRSSFVIRNPTFTLDLRSLSAGVYLVKLSAGGAVATQKLVVRR